MDDRSSRMPDPPLGLEFVPNSERLYSSKESSNKDSVEASEKAIGKEREDEETLESVDEKIEDDERWPMVEAVVRELRRTDNILVTEIGKMQLMDYIHNGSMETSGSGRFCCDKQGSGLCRCREWALRNEQCFWYLMEILQANLIYFLKRRYFDLGRRRETKHRSGSGIVEDFQTVFDKASSSRYLANREGIVSRCFHECDGKRYQHGRGCLPPKSIKNALFRLHKRAGIYRPPMEDGGEDNESSPGLFCAAKINDDAYWIDLWWVASSLLVWMVEPSVEITRLLAPEDNAPRQLPRIDQNLYDKQHRQREQRPLKKRIIDTSPSGFAKQSAPPVLKISLKLLQSEVQKVGLFYDKVLLHDGPWDEKEVDEDYVPAWKMAGVDCCDETDPDSSEDGQSDEDKADVTSESNDDDSNQHDSEKHAVTDEELESERNATKKNGSGKDKNNPGSVLRESNGTKGTGGTKIANPKAGNERMYDKGIMGNKIIPSKRKLDSMNENHGFDHEEEETDAMAVFKSFWGDNYQLQMFGGEIVGV